MFLRWCSAWILIEEKKVDISFDLVLKSRRHHHCRDVVDAAIQKIGLV